VYRPKDITSALVIFGQGTAVEPRTLSEISQIPLPIVRLQVSQQTKISACVTGYRPAELPTFRRGAEPETCTAISQQVFPIVLDTDSPRFRATMEAMLRASERLKPRDSAATCIER
jgi:hypothetical protein